MPQRYKKLNNKSKIKYKKLKNIASFAGKKDFYLRIMKILMNGGLYHD